MAASSTPSDWLKSLNDVETAIAACLESLGRYQARFEELFDRPRQPLALPIMNDLPTPPALQQAELLTHSMEQLIAEQERVWREWQARLAAWQESVQQRRN